MKIQINSLTDDGIFEFEKLIIKFRTSKYINSKELNKLIFSEYFTKPLEDNLELNIESEKDKLAIATSISNCLDLKNNKELEKNKGLWTWLTGLFLHNLVPFNKNTGEVKFSSDNSLYIYDPSWNRYYRHLLAFPCIIYSNLGEKAKIFLRGSISERGELVEQLASVQDLQRNPGVVEAITTLYLNPMTNELKKGAGSKPNIEKNLGGQARRLREVLKQFALTYDLYGMNGMQIINLLPKEFERWKNS